MNAPNAVPNRIRPPAVADQFYPADPTELRGLVETLLAQAPAPAVPAPKALIAPHAGYVYSGPIAASAYVHWAAERDRIKRIVLMGPSHFVALKGVAASTAEAFATPLGLVPVDLGGVQEVVRLAQVTFLDAAHAREHSLEVQLPFLQVVLGNFTLVPLVAGDAAPAQISAVLDQLWGGPETRFVISSDLSHYLDSKTARRLDRATADAIEALDLENLAEHQACGQVPIRGMIHAASQHGLRARTVDLRNSGDTAGSHHQVVGYGAFIFSS